jgi:transposase
MSKSKPYSAVAVNRVVAEPLCRSHPGQKAEVGCDIGKRILFAVVRWGNGDFERPWRVANPEQIPELVKLLGVLAGEHPVRVALEPSGTYGDALRQALHDAHLETLRVSPKAAHDYAEIFDGTPSQHDGKDAAILAELAALGKAAPWPYQARPAWQEELDFHVDWLELHRRSLQQWAGRLEALLARHWPEATRLLRVTSATLLHALVHYSSPQALAADPAVLERLAGWAGASQRKDKLEQFIEQARRSIGVRPSAVEKRRLCEYARKALTLREQISASKRQLRKLAAGHPSLAAQARAVGGCTACVLFSCVGEPGDYFCGAAYRKAMGLNLREYSSGSKQGELHISKRGNPRARRWLYQAALRLLKKPGVGPWYQAKKKRDGGKSKKAVVAVMRRLALALYQVGAKGASFEPARLFAAAVGAKRG